MGQPIEGGLVSDFIKLLPSLFKTVFEDLTEDGNTCSEYSKLDDGGFAFTVTSEQGNKLHIKALHASGRKNLYDYYIVGDNNSKQKYLSKSPDSLDDCVAEFLDKYYDEPDTVDLDTKERSEESKDIDLESGFESSEGELESSKKIQISLSKVQGSDEIVHSAIFCNYDALEVYTDLENVLDDETFVNTLTENEQCFEITPDNEGYNVLEIAEVEEMDDISEILKAQFRALLQLYAKANDISQGEDALSKLSNVQWQLDTLIRLSCSKHCNLSRIIEDVKAECSECCLDVPTIVENYCVCLDVHYPNFDHELQKMFDDWLLTLRYHPW